jgi:hypothetical protein
MVIVLDSIGVSITAQLDMKYLVVRLQCQGAEV